MQITDILDNVSKVIVGKEEVTKKVITSILAGGHILLEDVPGMGKTMLAILEECSSHRICFHQI